MTAGTIALMRVKRRQSQQQLCCPRLPHANRPTGSSGADCAGYVCNHCLLHASIRHAGCHFWRGTQRLGFWAAKKSICIRQNVPLLRMRLILFLDQQICASSLRVKFTSCSPISRTVVLPLKRVPCPALGPQVRLLRSIFGIPMGICWRCPFMTRELNDND